MLVVWSQFAIPQRGWLSSEFVACQMQEALRKNEQGTVRDRVAHKNGCLDQLTFQIKLLVRANRIALRRPSPALPGWSEVNETFVFQHTPHFRKSLLRFWNVLKRSNTPNCIE